MNRYKIKDNVDLKELEKYGFKTFYGFDGKTLFAIRDMYVEKNYILRQYRGGVDENNRFFRKSKYRPGKCLLSVKVVKNDIKDLIDNSLVERGNL